MKTRAFLSLTVLFALAAPGCSFNWSELEPTGAAGAAGTQGQGGGMGTSGSSGAAGAAGAAGATAGGAAGAGGGSAGKAGTSGASGKGGGSGASGAGAGAGAAGAAAAGGAAAGGAAGAAAGGASGTGGDPGVGGAAGAGGDPGVGGAAGAGGDPGVGGAAGTGAAGAAGSTAGSAGSAGSGGGTLGCTAPAMELGGGCYFLLNQPHSRGFANNLCGMTVPGAHLAIFPDQATQDLVMGPMGLKPMGSDYWFAVDCAAQNMSCNSTAAGVWDWLGGTALGYMGWAAGEPNSGTGCARLASSGGAFQWKDEACNNKYAAVCQEK